LLNSILLIPDPDFRHRLFFYLPEPEVVTVATVRRPSLTRGRAPLIILRWESSGLLSFIELEPVQCARWDSGLCVCVCVCVCVGDDGKKRRKLAYEERGTRHVGPVRAGEAGYTLGIDCYDPSHPQGHHMSIQSRHWRESSIGEKGVINIQIYIVQIVYFDAAHVYRGSLLL